MAADSAIHFVDLERQYLSIREEIDATVLDAIASTQYILGEEVTRFEAEFAAYCDAAHCVGLGSGAAAIELALEVLGVSEGDKVIAPANTFFGTVLPVLRLGATPVLVDCDEDTATVDPDRAASAIGPRTKAVIAVHLYGQPADVGPLREVCDAGGVTLVEDACQPHGARYKGRRAGSLGKIAAFSFYPSKNLGAYGDGGAVTTDDEELAKRIRVLRNVGQTDKYRHVAAGANERLDTIQAAVLRVKLRHLDRWNALRNAHAAKYRELAGRCEHSHAGNGSVGRARLAPLRRSFSSTRRPAGSAGGAGDRYRPALPPAASSPAGARSSGPRARKLPGYGGLGRVALVTHVRRTRQR